jgi:hypothetical protein
MTGPLFLRRDWIIVAPDNFRILQSDAADNTNHTNASNPMNSGQNDGQAYEFVAFLLWYIFLVLCCIVPTCCAYRRRRLMEQRLAMQQTNMSRLQASNLFILSNLSYPRRNTERVIEERKRILTEEIKGTTMVSHEL